MAKHFKSNNKKIAYFIFIILIILSVLYIIYLIALKIEARKESNLLNSIEIENNYNEITVNITNETNNETVEKPVTERMLKVRELKKENTSIVGWIEIEGTRINYPVVQGEDNEYYLDHNYKGEKTANGSIFLNKDCDLDVPCTNLLIYGHNMKNGEMFTDLIKYQNEDYYIKHPKIRFTTAEEDSEYEIFSVFKSRVYFKSETNVFRYYNFINANNEAEYNEFAEKAKSSSIYDTGITANYGDDLITLITCSYHVDDGRLAVIGRKSHTENSHKNT